MGPGQSQIGSDFARFVPDRGHTEISARDGDQFFFSGTN